jgi:hypothetical protein
MTARDPILLLLNARLEWLAETGDATVAIAGVAHALAEARARGWTIVHGYHPKPRALHKGAIPGLEPRTDEPLIELATKNALMSLDERFVRDRALYLAGSVFSRAGLATALAASDHGCAIAFIEDAVLASAEARWVRSKMTPPVIWPVSGSVLFDNDSAIVNFLDMRLRGGR